MTRALYFNLYVPPSTLLRSHGQRLSASALSSSLSYAIFCFAYAISVSPIFSCAARNWFNKLLIDYPDRVWNEPGLTYHCRHTHTREKNLTADNDWHWQRREQIHFRPSAQRAWSHQTHSQLVRTQSAAVLRRNPGPPSCGGGTEICLVVQHDCPLRGYLDPVVLPHAFLVRELIAVDPFASKTVSLSHIPAKPNVIWINAVDDGSCRCMSSNLLRMLK